MLKDKWFVHKVAPVEEDCNGTPNNKQALMKGKTVY